MSYKNENKLGKFTYWVVGISAVYFIFQIVMGIMSKWGVINF